MSTERIPCKNEDCSNTILPATAERNDGLCAPCVGEIAQAAHRKYVQENRRTVNLYDGVTDPVDALVIMHTNRKNDELVEYVPSPKSLAEWVSELTAQDMERLMDRAIAAVVAGDTGPARDLGQILASHTRHCLDRMLHRWLDAGHMDPEIAFRGAGPEIRDRLFELMSAAPPSAPRKGMDAGAILAALAWIGDSIVQSQFRKWEQHPPPWRKTLYCGPAGYAHVAGWELTDTGRRKLYYDHGVSLEPVAEESPEASGVALGRESGTVCPWCGSPLTYLLEIPPTEPGLPFMRDAGAALRVLTCERCTGFTDHLFARPGSNGEMEWHPANQRPPYIGGDGLFGRPEWMGKKVRFTPRLFLEADWDRNPSSTVIGGLPTWVQDTAYPNCPDCTQLMKFVAQLDEAYFPMCEGVYYAFRCEPCGTTATCYQQT